jgi:hypothetical protein
VRKNLVLAHVRSGSKTEVKAPVYDFRFTRNSRHRRVSDCCVSVTPRTGNRSRAVSSRACARTCARGIVSVFGMWAI